MKTPPGTLALRGSMYFALWLVLMPSAKPGDLAFGLVAAFAATWSSLALLPPAAGQLRPGALLLYFPRFLWKSVLAGFDIARRTVAKYREAMGIGSSVQRRRQKALEGVG